jgi:hypothetical protein
LQACSKATKRTTVKKFLMECENASNQINWVLPRYNNRCRNPGKLVRI